MRCAECDRDTYAKGLCRSHYERQLRQRNPEFAERQRANRRQWGEQNPDKVRELYERRRDAGANRDRAHRTYRITREEYRAIVSQPCGLCGTTEKRRYLDHDHETGRIRGPLCHGCNLGVGFIERRGEEWASRALAWLRGLDGRS